MRTIVVALAFLVAVTRAQADGPMRGFDHGSHARALDGARTEPLACARCHANTAGVLAGKPGHAACFGACHGPSPTLPPRGKSLTIAPERIRLCTTCHTDSTIRTAKDARAFAVAYPPYAVAPDFVLQVGHKRHAAVTCAQCHVDPPRPAHRRCAGCHDGTTAKAGKGPAMTACTSCHTPATREVDPCTTVAEGCRQILVRTAFSHPRHTARGARCSSCHAAVSGSDARQVSRPSERACSGTGCHDGAAAFPVTAACTKCHKDVPATKFKVSRPDQRFSHDRHLPRLGGTLACAGCHVLGKTGEVAVAGHEACASCHADDFHAREQVTCGACHNATEPWRPLVPDAFPPARSEFGAALDHRKHDLACTACHTLTTATAQLRPPRGHRACTGKGCHATTGGAAPMLPACERCHQIGRASGRLASRLAAPWSVRARFDHARHRVKPDATPLPCTACHTNLSEPDLGKLATPAKTTCVPCHDGQASFKLTGTGCMRCHGPHREDAR